MAPPGMAGLGDGGNIQRTIRLMKIAMAAKMRLTRISLFVTN
jgi:hypothetical protein